MSGSRLDPGLVERLIRSLGLQLLVEISDLHGEEPADIRSLFAESQRLNPGSSLPPGLADRPALLWVPAGKPGALDHLVALTPLNPRSAVVVTGISQHLSPGAGTGMMDLLTSLKSLSAHHRLLFLEDTGLYFPELADAAVRDYTGRRGIDWTDSRYRNEEIAAAEAAAAAKDKVIAELSRDLEAISRDRADKEEFIERLSNELPFMQTLIFVDAKLRRYLGAILWPARLAVRLLLKVMGALFAIRLTHDGQYPPRPLPPPADYQSFAGPSAPPLISIVTPSFNQAEFLGATINSVLSQEYPKLEYIVQDGGSQDGTVEVLTELSGFLSHWESAPDSGQANAVNLGMRRATGEILAWLNSDDLLLPGSLAYVAAFFERHPEVDVVYGNRILIDADGRDIGRWIMPPHDDETLRWADYVPQETLFWRRSIWQAIGGCLDEDFHFALDWDLLLRFREAGARMARLPRFTGAFRIHNLQKNYTIGHVHSREVRKLIGRTHGREMSAREIHRHMKPFFRRHIACDRLYRLGLTRYGIKRRLKKRPSGIGVQRAV